MTASVSAISNPYMFSGRRYDDETGLYYYRARMYAPNLGRFMQTDPIDYSDGMNMYSYVGNNPLAYTDPSGLCKHDYLDYLSLYMQLSNPLSMLQMYNDFVLDLITDSGRFVGAGLGDEALDYYANRIAFEDGGLGSYAGAFFSGMWTPETYKTTLNTLVGAYVGGRFAKPKPQPTRINSARVLERSAQEPGPFHNFPQSFDEVIFNGRRTVHSASYIEYTQTGSINGHTGTYQIGVKPSSTGSIEVIVHRFFKPN